MRLYVYSSKSELKKFDDMNFQDQLQHAHQHQSLRTGSESRIQRLGFVNLDGTQDPFQELSLDPWKGKGHQEEKVKLPEGHQEEKVNLPEQYKMCTPPRYQRVSHSPTKLPVPPGLAGLAVPEGQQSRQRPWWTRRVS